jgi:hypothetical protein
MPSFNLDTKVDKAVKEVTYFLLIFQNLIRDTFTILNINSEEKQRKADFYKRELKLRRKNVKTTREFIETMIANGLKQKKVNIIIFYSLK